MNLAMYYVSRHIWFLLNLTSWPFVIVKLQSLKMNVLSQDIQDKSW